jgi:hypothetical protein
MNGMSTATPTQQAMSLPFGRHKDKPIGEVPADYLQWLLATCKLSSGLRAAVANELASRGVEVPSAPPPRPISPCRDCGPGAGHVLFWMQDRLGRKRIRAECKRCRRLVDHPPCVEPYVSMADATASPTAMLDALTRLDDLGVELHRDGRGAWIGGDDYRKVPPDLRALVKQCSNELAKMLSDNTRRRN